MARPRSLKVKLVLDVPEVVYQRMAVKAFQASMSVSEWAGKMLDNGSEAVAPLPLFEVAVAPSPEVAPAAPTPEPEVSHSQNAKKGKSK